MPGEPESGPPAPPGAPQPGDEDRGRYEAKSWGLPFGLFVAGFALLVVVTKLNVSLLTGNVLKGVGGGLCIGAVIIIRRRLRNSRVARREQSK